MAEDNCGTVTITETTEGGPLYGTQLVPGTYNIQYVAEDAAHLTDTCNFTIVIVDDGAPLLVCQPDITVVANNDSCSYTSTAGEFDPLLSVDNCPGYALYHQINTSSPDTSRVPATTFPIGVNTITYILTDIGGDTVRCSFTVTVIDDQAPKLTCVADTVAVTDANECNFTYYPNITNALASDNCSVYDSLNITYRVFNPDHSLTDWRPDSTVYEFEVGISLVEYRVIDKSGNETRCIQQVTVQDKQAPQVIVPTISSPYNNTPGICGYTVTDTTFDATANDNCGVVSLTHNYGAWGNPYSLAGATFPIDTTVVIWTAVDAQGNTTIDSIMVVVVDAEAPTFVNCPSDTTFTIGADLNCTTGVIWPIPVAEDNCGTVTVTETTEGGPLYGTQLVPGTYNIQYVAEDAAHLTDTCNFTIVIVDDGAPLLVCQPDITVVANNDSCSYTSTAGEFDPLLSVDNCPGYALYHQINTSSPDTSRVPATTFPIGVNTITYILTDIGGDTVRCSFTVTVIDDQAPKLTCVADTVAVTDANECNFTYYPNITNALASDNCSVYDSLNITYRVFNPDHSLTDWRPDSTVYEFEVGISLVEYRVIDKSGNETRCIQQVTVQDKQAPQVIVPTISSPYNNTPGICGYTVTDTTFDATANDNCGVVSLTHNYGAWGNPYSLAGATFPIDTTVVIWTAVDAQGNTTIDSIMVVVVDAEAPTFVNCPSDTTFTIGADLNCTTGVIWPIPVAEDNCGTVTVTETTEGGPLYGTQLVPGTYNIQYVAEDAAHLTDTCNFTIVIVDDGAPLLVCQPDITVVANNDSCSYTSTAGEFDPLLSVDNCPGYALYHQINTSSPDTSRVPATTFPIGVNTITYILTDIGGDTVRCSFTVTVIDDQAPKLTCVADTVAVTDANECNFTYYPNITNALASDNCSVYDSLNITYRVFNPDHSLTDWRPDSTVYEFEVGISLVEYRVIDKSGNETRCIQQVTVQDKQAPQVIVPTISSPYNNTPGICGYTVTDTTFDATANDNCGVVSLTHNYGAWGNPYSLAGATFPIDTTVVIWTAVDAQGNTTIDSIMVVVVDAEAPTFVNCPSDTTFTIGADLNCTTGVIWPIPVAEDNCGTVTVTETTEGGPLYGTQLTPGTYPIRYIATDGAGLQDTCNFTIIIVDDGAPLLVCQPDITVVADLDSCSYTSTAGEFDPLLSVDNCPGYALYHQINTSSPDTGRVPATNFPVGVNTITYILADIGSDTVRCSFTVTVTDNQAPMLICVADTTAATDVGECYFTYHPSINDTLVSDNCTSYDNLDIQYRVFNPDHDLTTWITNNTPYNFEVGISQVEYRVIDEAGNETRCIQQVTVTDNQAPIITCPTLAASYENTPGICGYVVSGNQFDATATDNCPGVTLTHNYGAWGNPYSLAGATFPIDTTIVRWTAVDIYGNSSYCDIIVVVKDTEAPTFVNCPEGTTFTIGADVNCATGVIWSIPVAQDNCGTVTVTETTEGGPLYGTQLTPGTYPIRYIATDGAGLQDTCNFTIIIVDDGAPLLVCQPDITVVADLDSCSYTSTAGEFDPLLSVDNCPGYALYHQINTSSPDTGRVPATNFPVGVNTITYILADIGSDTVRCSFTVTVTDNQAPMLICVADTTAATDVGECYFTYHPSINDTLVSDNCTSYDNLDIQYRVFNPDHDLTTWITNNTPYNFEVGISQVEYRVIDEAGNETRCIQQVTVTDNQAPIITCPTLAASYENTPGICGYVVSGNQFDATATDNCPGVTLTHNYGAWGNPYSLAGATFPIDTTIVRWTAVDIYGNSSYCDIIVVVKDTEAPTFVNCPESTTFTIGADINCTTGVIWSIPIAEDNCGTVTVTETTVGGPLHGTQLVPGTYNIQYVAEDAAHLTDTCNFTIVIVDDGAPLLVCQPDITVVANNDSCSYTSTAGEFDPLLSVDNCPGYALYHQINTSSPDTGRVPATNFPVGVNTITYILADIGSDTVRCSFTVTVTDNQAPMLICVADTTAATDVGECYFTYHPSINDTLVSDNCTSYDNLDIQYRVFNPDHDLTTWITNNTPYNFEVGISQVEYRVIDEAGNETRCIQQVTVTDNQAPIITCPTLAASYENTPGICGYVVSGNQFDATATDNCPGVTLTHNYGAWGNPYSLAGATFPIDTTIVRWTAVDIYGNSSYCDIIVVVKDTEAPTFVNCPESTTFTIGADINCTTGVIWSIPIAEDNCGTVTVTETTVGGPLHGTQLVPGMYNIQYTATDGAGLTATCNFTIVIVDDGAPLLVCQPDITVVANNDSCSYTSTAGEFDPLLSVDNCPGYALYHQINTSSPDTGRVPATNFPVGVNTITYILADIGSDTVRCSFTVTVTDNQAPMLICVADTTAATDVGECYFTYHPSINDTLVSDNCTSYDNLDIQYRVFNPDHDLTTWITNNTPYNFEVGISQVEYRVIDEAGNETRCIQQVTVTDNQAPIITCPTLAASYENTPGICGYVVSGNQFDATATDNCPGVTLTHNYGAWGNPYSLAGATFPIDTTIVRWTAVDIYGNSSYCDIIVVVKDTEAPTFVNCPESTTFTIGADINCTTGVIWSIPIAEDNCGTVTVTETTVGGPLHGTQLVPGTYNIQYVAEDAAHLTDTCNFTIVIVDDGAPLLVCQPDITVVANNDSCSYTSTAGEFDPLLSVDNCPGYALYHQINTSSPDTGRVPATNFPVGVNTITYILADIGSDTVRCSFTVTVTDNQAPMLICVADTTAATDVGECYFTYHPSINDTLVSDNCTSYDNLDIQYRVFNPDHDLTTWITNNTPYNFEVGISQVEYRVIDEAGNETRCIQQVTVTDNQAPIITCPTLAASYENTPGICGYVVSGNQFDATATDNCPGVTLTHNYGAWGNPYSLAGATFPIDTTIVRWTAVDIYGNSSYCDIIVVVKDTEAPTFVNCPESTTFTIGADINCTTGVIWSIPIAEDNCGTVTVTETTVGGPLHGTQLVPGMYNIQYTATDGAGLTATCNFTVIITDDGAPLLVVQPDITLPANIGVCTYTSSAGEFDPLLAVDNCPGYTLTHQIGGGAPAPGVVPDGTLFPLGETLITYILTDVQGNSITQSFTITIVDTQVPVILSCPTDVTATTDVGECDYTYTPHITSAMVMDNCNPYDSLMIRYRVANPDQSESGWRLNNTPYDFDVGISQVLYVVVDKSGNFTECIQQITVTDNQAPTITCNTLAASYPNTTGMCGYVVNGTQFDPLTIDDNCGVLSITHNFGDWANPSSLAGTTFPVGITPVRWTVVDIHGNTSFCDISVKVIDTEAPTFVNCPEGTTFTIGADINCTTGVIWSIPIAEDNCGTVTVTETTVGGPLHGTQLAPGTYNIQYTATDGVGLTATCNFTVVITDDGAPLLVVQPDITLPSDAGVCTYTSLAGEFDPLLAVDNCPGYTLSHQINSGTAVPGSVPAGTQFPLGSTIITYILTDNHGNNITQSFTITIEDQEAPTIVCPAPLVLTPNSAGCVATHPLLLPNVADNCSSTLSISYSVINPDNTFSGPHSSAELLYTFQVGNSIVLWTVTDAAGNSAQCVQNVLVESDVVAASEVLTHNQCNAVPGVGSVKITTNLPGIVVLNGVSHSIVNAPYETIFTNLLSGYYTATFIADSSSCSATTTFNIINQNSDLIASVAVPPILCNDSTTTATITVMGGTAPYQYILNGDTIASNGVIENVLPGIYNIEVVDANQCSYFLSFTVVEPTQMVANFGCPSCVVDVDCHGEATGMATVTITGGTTPYTYAWSHDPLLNNRTATGLTAGTHTVTITDANGCETTAEVTINEPAAPLALSGIITDADCYGTYTGSVSVTVTGGTQPYSYVWSNGMATPTISGLASDNYFVTVTDAHGCTIVGGAYQVDEPTEIAITVTSITHTYCNSNMGAAVITTTEAGTITVNGNNYIVTSPDFEATVTGLAAGYYTAIFTNSAGCTSQTSFNITNQNSTLSATLSIFDILCFGGTGSVTVTPTGGVAPYLYALNNGSAQSSPTFTDLTAGAYIVTVYDATGCTFVLNFTITEPAPLTVGILQQTNETCYNARNGSATLITSGGVTPYAYQWPTTANNQTGQTAVNLAPGTYVVTITDANNCTTTQSVTISAALMTIPNAGNDSIICETAGFLQIQGASATHYESVYWTTNGTGTFSNLFAMNPIYYPSAADIANGTVILTLHAVPHAPCAETSDQMVLQIIRQPQVTLADDIICGGEQIEPVANAQYGTAYTWTSSGTGTFTNPNQVNTVYIPSATDIANGFVNLTLTAQAASPCATVSEVGHYVIVQPVIANAGADQSLHGVSSTILAANNPAPASGIWTLVSGPNNPVIANPTQYNTTISGLIEGEYVFQWTISNDPCEPSSDLMTIVVANSADLMIQKSTSNANPVAGSTFNYTITVTNLGSSAAQDVVVTDPLPDGLTLNNVVVTRGSWTTPLWTIGTLNVGQVASMSMTVTVDPSTTDGTQIYNVATVTSPTPDPNPNNNVDSVPIVVATYADLAIVKTTLQNTVIAGEEITYQLTVTNHGPSDALNTVVNDVLPNGLTLISATPSVGTWLQPNWSLGTLPVGETETLTIVAATSPDLQPGTITNNATVTSTTPDPVLSNNSSSVTNNIIVLADVEVIKVGSKHTVIAGDTMTYYITVTNHGPSTATSVVMTDLLPTNLTLISQTVSTGTWLQPNWSIGNMLPGATETMSIVVRVNGNVNQGSIIVNNATVTSPTPDLDLTNNHSTYNVVVETITDLQVVKTADQTQVSAGEVITYTIDVYNHGPSYAHNVVMKDLLPPNTTVQNVVTSTGSWLLPQWYIGTMADGAHEIMTITLLVNTDHPDNSIVHNVATVESTTPETDLSNNISDVDVAVVNNADLELTKICLEEVVYPGDIITYVISVTNNGPADAVNVVVTDNYPAELTVISAQPSAGTWTMPDTWTINRIASGETVTMMMQMKLSDDVDGNVTISNYAVVTSDTPDPNLANNDDTVDISTAYADLAITKVSNATNVIVNELVEYKITATNLGVSDAFNVVITDQLPDGLELVHATGEPEVNGTLLTWRLARLDVGETYEITLVARVVRDAIVGEVIVNTVTISSETEDIDLSNNSDSAEILVDPLLVPFIPEGFSPNGDGYNDFFVIDGLERYPNNKLTIFNRWGNIVFEGAPYTNNFDGTTNKGLRIGGDQLPSGTYFYILDLGVKDIEPIRGYIYLAR